MAISVIELKALAFGYLTGADLKQFCAAPLLIKIYEVDNDSLQAGCNIAYSELTSNLANRYNIANELSLTSGRNLLCVKLASILAVHNILGDAYSSETTVENYKDAKKDLIAIRNGQLSLNLKLPENSEGEISPTYSDAQMIRSNFHTLG